MALLTLGKAPFPAIFQPRSIVDQAVNRMSLRAVWATDQIATLAEHARSEAVRLMALRSKLSDMMAVADFARLEECIAKLEEQDRVAMDEGHDEGHATRRRPFPGDRIMRGARIH